MTALFLRRTSTRSFAPRRTKRWPRWAATATLVGCLAGPVGADDPLQTDRPDVAETSTVVGAGRFQIETSVLFERTRRRNGRERLVATPTLFRLGVSSRWEARIETDGYSRLRSDFAGADVRTAGISPIEIGTKYHFADERGPRPSLAWLLHVGVPSGSGGFRAEEFDLTTKILADWELAPRQSLGLNVGLALPVDDSGSRFLQGLYAVALGHALDSRLRVYVELSGQLPAEAGGSAATLLDGGAAYLLSADVQIDFAIGTGLGGPLPDFFWTVGWSRRY